MSFVRIRARVRVWVRVRIWARVRVWVRVRIWARVRVGVRVRIWARVRVGVRVRIRAVIDRPETEHYVQSRDHTRLPHHCAFFISVDATCPPSQRCPSSCLATGNRRNFGRIIDFAQYQNFTPICEFLSKILIN